MIFKDRKHAGVALSKILKKKVGKSTIVVSPSKGGIELALEISKELKLGFDFLPTAKIALSFNSDIAIGAISECGAVHENFTVARDLRITPREFAELKEHAEQKLALESKKVRSVVQKKDYKNKEILIVDDGISTGATISSAILEFQKAKAKKILAAVPVCAPESIVSIARDFPSVQITCLSAPRDFMAVGQYYEKYPKLSIDDAIAIIKKANSKVKK